MSRMKILSRPIGLLGAVALVLGAAACGSDETAPDVAPPEVVSFTAEPGSVSLGGEVQLHWETLNARQIKILDGRNLPVPTGDEKASEGSVTVIPSSTTTYSLTAIGANGLVSPVEQVTVQVVPFPDPTIERFRATPEEVAFAGDVVLSWSTTNAVSVSIADSFGRNVDLGDADPAEGMVTVNPKVETTYTLTAVGKGGGKKTDKAPVRLAQNPAVSIKAAKGTVVYGEVTELIWSATLAEHVVIQPEGGEPIVDTWESMSGTNLVQPTRSTIYVITATGRGGTVNAAVPVHVAPRIDSFTHDATAAVRPGESVKVSWKVTGATAITITNESGFSYDAAANELQQGIVTAPVTMTGSFLLIARSGDTETRKHLTVELEPAPRVREFKASPATVTAGSTTILSWLIDGSSRISIEARPEGLADHIPGTFLDLVGKSTRADEVEIQVDMTTTYRMTAYGGGMYSTLAEVKVQAQE